MPSAAAGTAPSVTFVLVAPQAQRVALAGDFNDWDASRVLMRREARGSGRWTCRSAPGRYRYVFVVDGRRFVADPAAPRAAGDDFGTPTSVVTVGGGALARRGRFAVNDQCSRAVACSPALALPSGAARAQTQRLAGRLDERTRAEVAALVDSARGAGLPGGPARQQGARGREQGRRRRAHRRRGARARGGPGAGPRGPRRRTATEPELVAGAAALRAGAPPAFVERLRRDYPREPLVVPLAVMADLVARGVPADTAAQSVLALVRAGVREAELVAFRQSVERDIALGRPAGTAAAATSASTPPSATRGHT